MKKKTNIPPQKTKIGGTEEQVKKIIFEFKKPALLKEKLPNIKLFSLEYIKQNPWKVSFWILLAFLGVLMPLLSLDSGVSGDEFVNYRHAGYVYDYYAKGDTSSINTHFDPEGKQVSPTYLEYYGQSFDNLTYLVNKVLGVQDYYMSRHIMNALVGWCILLVLGLFLYRIWGWRAAVLGSILLFLSPRFLGHSFNNPKDIPFALGYILSIYQMFRLCSELPVLRFRRLVYLALSIALAISIRIGGLILIPYLFLFVGIQFLLLNPFKKFTTSAYWNQGFKLIFILLLTCLAGFLIGLLYWPYALQAPFKNSVASLELMTQFAVSLKQVFEGKFIWSDMAPWYYLPKYILITIPIVILVGVALFIVFSKKLKKEISGFVQFLLIFSFAFPILYIIYKHANVYGGWRHVLFTYPFLVIIAAIGFEACLRYFETSKKIKALLLVLFTGLNAIPLVHIIKNHPHEYVYFNELTGGMNKAYDQYELDYYFHSMRAASDWIKENVKPKADGSPTIIAAWLIHPLQYYFRNDTNEYQVSFARYYERGNTDWDYAVYVNTGISPQQRKNGSFPPKNMIHAIEVDGKPICVILKRDDKHDFLAYEQKKIGNIDSAITLYNIAIQKDPFNEPALSNLGELYLQQNRLDEAIATFLKLVDIAPFYDQANYYLAYSYFLKNDYDKTIDYCERTYKNNSKFTQAYTLAANAYIRKNDLLSAQKILEELVQNLNADNESFNTLIQIYKSQGLDERLAVKKVYLMLSKSAEKKGKKAEAKEYKKQADSL